MTVDEKPRFDSATVDSLPWVGPADLHSPFSTDSTLGATKLLKSGTELTGIRWAGIDTSLTGAEAFPYDLYLYLSWIDLSKVNLGLPPNVLVGSALGVSMTPQGAVVGTFGHQFAGPDVYDYAVACVPQPFIDSPNGLNGVRTSLVNVRNDLINKWQDIRNAVTPVLGGDPTAGDLDEQTATWVGQGASNFAAYITAVGAVVTQLANDMGTLIDDLDILANALQTGMTMAWTQYAHEIVDAAATIIRDFQNQTAQPAPDVNVDVEAVRNNAVNATKTVLAPLFGDILQAKADLAGIVAGPLNVPFPALEDLEGDGADSDTGSHATGPDPANSQAHDPSAQQPKVIPQSTGGSTNPEASATGGAPMPAISNPAPDTGAVGMPVGLTMPAGLDSGNGTPADATAARQARLRSLTVKVGNTTVTVPDGPNVGDGTASAGRASSDITIQDGGVTVTVHEGQATTGTDGATTGTDPAGTDPLATETPGADTVVAAQQGATANSAVPGGANQTVLADPSLAGATGANAAQTVAGVPADTPANVMNPAVNAQTASYDPTSAAASGQPPVSISDASGTYTLNHQAGSYQVGDMTVQDTISGTGAETVSITSPDGTSITITDQVDPSQLDPGGEAVPGGGQQVTGAPPGQFVDWSQAAGADPTAVANALAADGIDPRAYFPGTDPAQAVPPAAIDPSQGDPTAGNDAPGTV